MIRTQELGYGVGRIRVTEDEQSEWGSFESEVRRTLFLQPWLTIKEAEAWVRELIREDQQRLTAQKT